MPYPKFFITTLALTIIAMSAFFYHAAFMANGNDTQDIYYSLSYVVIMYSMMCFELVRRIMSFEKIDHNQNRIDLILSSLKLQKDNRFHDRPGIADLFAEDAIDEEDFVAHIQLPKTSDNYFEFRHQD